MQVADVLDLFLLVGMKQALVYNLTVTTLNSLFSDQNLCNIIRPDYQTGTE